MASRAWDANEAIEVMTSSARVSPAQAAPAGLEPTKPDTLPGCPGRGL